MDTSTGTSEPDTSDRGGARLRTTAAALVTFLGLYQGAVPLVARLAFGAEQRFAPALWLPSPWWWITCVAIVVVTVAVLAAIDTSRDEDRAPSADAVGPEPPASDEEDEQNSTKEGTHDALSGLVFLIGVYNGVAPFVARLVFGRDGLLLALPLRLPTPWWWITSLLVVGATIALLAAIDRDKHRRVSVGDAVARTGRPDGPQSGIPSPEQGAPTGLSRESLRSTRCRGG